MTTQATQFPLSTDLVVSVTNPPPGFAGFNTGNLAIFSDDPYGNTFPASGIQYYTSPTQVGIDFGTSSKTYAEAVAVFSQNPNLLLPGGQLIVIGMISSEAGQDEIQNLNFSGTPTTGTYKITYNGNQTTALTPSSNAGAVQAALRLLAGLGSAAVTGAIPTFSVDFGFQSPPATPLTITYDSLQDTNGNDVFINVSTTQAGIAPGATETIAQCLARTINLVSYAAVIPNEIYETIGSTAFKAAASAFQAVPVLFGVVGHTPALNQAGGDFLVNTTSGNTHTRTLTYEDPTVLNMLAFLAGDFSLLLSVDYEGSNTCITTNMKQLAGVPPDSVIQPGTDFVNAKAAGSDVYILSVTGNSGVRSFGANLYADEIANELWLQGAILTAYYNALETTSTKIPQTEDGMNEIKAALRQVLLQSVANGMVAPGSWQSPNTFGNITDFYTNISQFGFYMYSTPISQQSESDRVARTAPIIQIAVKLSGAVQNASVIITVNP
jgi:hypothetical protein